MSPQRLVFVVGVAVVLAAVFLMGRNAGFAAAQAEKANRIFEIRTYTAADGKLDNVLSRFRDHTCKLFEKHGMTNIAYFVPADEPDSKNTLVYILAHDSREAAKKSWDEFRNDPEWKQVREESEANGKIVLKTVSVFANPTDFSPLK